MCFFLLVFPNNTTYYNSVSKYWHKICVCCLDLCTVVADFELYSNTPSIALSRRLGFITVSNKEEINQLLFMIENRLRSDLF